MDWRFVEAYESLTIFEVDNLMNNSPVPSCYLLLEWLGVWESTEVKYGYEVSVKDAYLPY